jgi:hypothetical protein
MLQHFDSSVVVLLSAANESAVTLINLLTSHFSCFNDVHKFEDTTVRIHKRAQILVADLWACFEGEGYGRFDDVSEVTMFAGKERLPASGNRSLRGIRRLPYTTNAAHVRLSGLFATIRRTHPCKEAAPERKSLGD